MRTFSYALVIIALAATSACNRQDSAHPVDEERPVGKVAAPVANTFKRPVFDVAAMQGNVVQSACFVTSINSDPVPATFEIKNNQALDVNGWTANLDFSVPQSVVFIIRNGNVAFDYPAQLGPDKARAAEVLGKPQLANAGYVSKLDLNGVPPGPYEMWIGQVGQADTKYCLIDNKILSVVP